MTSPTFIILALLATPPSVPAPLRLQAADPKAEAASAFQAGEESFRNSEFDDAVLHFQRAQRLSPHPHTLYNLGLAQQQAGDLPAAWTSFRKLEQTADSARERDDARQRLNRIEPKVAVLRIEAAPTRRICLDSQPIPRRTGATFEVAARAGEYELILDEHRLPVRLEEGETRVLALTGADQLLGVQPTHRAVPVLAGVTVGSAALSAALGGASLALRGPQPDRSFGLAIGATSAAALATATGVAALVLRRRSHHPRARAPGEASPTEDSCPAHPDLAESG